MTRRRGRALVLVLAVLGLAAGAAAAGLLIGKRLQTGEWTMPTGDDLVRIRRKVAGVPAGPPPPPRIIYLHRGPIRLTGGVDDAAARTSSVVAAAGAPAHDHGARASAPTASPASFSPPPAEARTVSLRGFRGSDRSWKRIVTCVEKLFAPFDVTVTDRMPAGEPYVMAVVGGRPRDIGHKGRVGGLAPFSGGVVQGAVVFAFADELRNQVQPVCHVIGMEVGHAYGLDHSYRCKDVMTYRTGCGAKSFVDADVPCGESKPRPCHGGATTQNSYRHLMAVLGPVRESRAAGGSRGPPAAGPSPR